jgi:hypothetical protein
VASIVVSLDPPDAGIVVFQMAADGSLLCRKSYDWDGVQSAADAVLDAEGGVLFVGQTNSYGAVGSDMYVLHTDRAGRALAEWVFGESLEESASRIFLGSQGDYFVVGIQLNPGDRIADAETAGYGGLEFRSAPCVARIRPNGAPVWKESYRSEDNVVVLDAAATRSGGCFVLSTVYGFPNADDAIRLDKVNDLGRIEWTRTFDAGNSKGYSLLPLGSGRLLIAGARSNDDGLLQGLLMLLDPTGREIWSMTYGSSGLITTLHAVVETADGRFVAAGTQLTDYGQYRDDVYLLCVDAEGGVIWEHAYPTGKHVMIEALREASDGGLLVAGTGAAAGERFQAMLMRVDPTQEIGAP